MPKEEIRDLMCQLWLSVQVIFHKVSFHSLNVIDGKRYKEIYDGKASGISAQIKNRCRTDLACCEARGWCHSGCWPPYLFQLTPSAQSVHLLLHQHAGEKHQGAAGDDDRLVLGVQGDAGAVLLLRLITILEVRMRTNPSLAGGSG